MSFKERGSYVVFILNSPGRYEFSLEKEGCGLKIIGLFIGKNSDNFEVKTTQIHKKRNCTSDLLIKSVLKDKAKFLYEGLIRIGKGAQKSFAYQKNENIILSKNAYVFSEPFLEIMANDVYCTHGSTTGQLDKEKVLYLKTRGIPEKKAEKLLLEGFCLDILKKIKNIEDKKLYSELEKEINKKLELLK